MMVVNILFATKKIISFDRYVLFCLKLMDTKNISKTEEKTCLL